ncbi:hypothetical protein [Legionella micdadei]|uniref:Uncharacterized protein n=1 Tax=Legionella micdadei TaxID=451 RepID=A0A098GCH8_LEGMI|nr:hypothetical protein [Legionella micdadei]ARG96477.1 hypothetical protein B6N58_01590 [Legionella micdadei]ARG99228.1 hypothetical protein B6V88_01580 [Legionella micdadei]KTD27900.1 hypothetical protein Lmic_1817 [Legionella micdadei]NSL18175.1 hypothetical protein [Legionella micdadei]CEG59695.1 protein of unknown function [Legionella micdadei]
MRKIQIERTLFELFGHKFFVFENFEDADLNIDDKTIYKFENPDTLVDLFVTNQFYAIWSDERRHDSNVICSCYGNLNLIVNFLKKIGIPNNGYSTFNCYLEGEDRVLYLNQESMQVFIDHLRKAHKKILLGANVYQLKKNEIFRL